MSRRETAQYSGKRAEKSPESDRAPLPDPSSAGTAAHKHLPCAQPPGAHSPVHPPAAIFQGTDLPKGRAVQSLLPKQQFQGLHARGGRFALRSSFGTPPVEKYAKRRTPLLSALPMT